MSPDLDDDHKPPLTREEAIKLHLRKPHWEVVHDNPDRNEATWRMMVPGGWLVRHEHTEQMMMEGRPVDIRGTKRTAMAFVPDPEHGWRVDPLQEEGEDQ